MRRIENINDVAEELSKQYHRRAPYTPKNEKGKLFGKIIGELFLAHGARLGYNNDQQTFKYAVMRIYNSHKKELNQRPKTKMREAVKTEVFYSAVPSFPMEEDPLRKQIRESNLNLDSYY